MARTESFEYQIDLAVDLRKFLVELQENLADAIRHYETTSDTMYDAGMMEEKHRVLEGYMYETVSLIKNTINKINDADIPYVDKYIGYLQESESIK